MAELLLANVESNTSDEELAAFLNKYGFPDFDDIQHIPGDGSRPAVLLTYRSAAPETLRALMPRIQDVFWNNRKLHVQLVAERYA